MHVEIKMCHQISLRMTWRVHLKLWNTSYTFWRHPALKIKGLKMSHKPIRTSWRDNKGASQLISHDLPKAKSAISKLKTIQIFPFFFLKKNKRKEPKEQHPSSWKWMRLKKQWFKVGVKSLPFKYWLPTCCFHLQFTIHQNKGTKRPPASKISLLEHSKKFVHRNGNGEPELQWKKSFENSLQLDKPQNCINRWANTHTSFQYITEQKWQIQAITRKNLVSVGLLKVFFQDHLQNRSLVIVEWCLGSFVVFFMSVVSLMVLTRRISLNVGVTKQRM